VAQRAFPIIATLRLVGAANAKIPVANARYAVILLNIPLSMTNPVTRIPKDRITIEYTISIGLVNTTAF
jgi:hypothetical protein